MTKSFCHHGTIPSDLMDQIEIHLSKNYDSQMQTSKIMGNNEVLDKEIQKMLGFQQLIGWVVYFGIIFKK